MEERETPLSLFYFWRTITQRHNAQPERWMLKKLEAAQNRFTDQQLRDAINGCTFSPFHNYAAPGQQRLTTLGVILASDESIARFAHLAKARRAEEKDQQQKRLQRDKPQPRHTEPARTASLSGEAIKAFDAIRHLLPRTRHTQCE